MNNRLGIIISKDANWAMLHFPLSDGQYIEAEQEEAKDCTIVMVDLGEYIDTTMLQEQFLNTNSDVIEYVVW